MMAYGFFGVFFFLPVENMVELECTREIGRLTLWLYGVSQVYAALNEYLFVLWLHGSLMTAIIIKRFRFMKKR